MNDMQQLELPLESTSKCQVNADKYVYFFQIGKTFMGSTLHFILDCISSL